MAAISDTDSRIALQIDFSGFFEMAEFHECEDNTGDRIVKAGLKKSSVSFVMELSIADPFPAASVGGIRREEAQKRTASIQVVDIEHLTFFDPFLLNA